MRKDLRIASVQIGATKKRSISRLYFTSGGVIVIFMDQEKKVLLVEDDKFLSSLLRSRLEREGIRVLYAENGEAALEILRNERPDLILLDIILPKKSGFEVLEEIKQNPLLQNSPVIIISCLGQESDISRGKELGAIEYFVKAQTSIDELVRKIKEFVAA